jgi:hypothetical protein
MELFISDYLFSSNDFVVDHWESIKDYCSADDFDKAIPKYIELFETAHKENPNRRFYFYCARDGWLDQYVDFLTKLDYVKGITGCLGNIPSIFYYVPHWQIMTDTDSAPAASEKIPQYRWNYWIRRPRWSRVYLLEQISKLNIPNGDIIFPKQLTELTMDRSWPPTVDLFSDPALYYNIESQLNDPVDILPGQNGVNHPSWIARQQRGIDVVVETMQDYTGSVFLSEKTWKPIRAGQLFLILGQPGTIESLRKLGFNVFDDYIDHSYDNNVDITKRIELLSVELNRLATLSKKEWKRLWNNTYKDRVFNQQHNKQCLKEWALSIASFD